MPDAIVCPICQKEVHLTVFGALPKHGGKSPCPGSGYTVGEASSVGNHMTKPKQSKSKGDRV